MVFQNNCQVANLFLTFALFVHKLSKNFGQIKKEILLRATKKSIPDDAFCTVVMLLSCVVAAAPDGAFVAVLAVDVDIAVSSVTSAAVAFDVVVTVVSTFFVVAAFVVVVVVVAVDVVFVSTAVELCVVVFVVSCGCPVLMKDI